ncbi:MAG: cobalamin-dependent protein [Candidatus Odinarchaeum yellowstonii]|uniref:Cobalamin-dependent protein n=1 Tax=Odinarchaeota yellowstonii (strain LCB_4) TaxID=1841599 RepID=A0AAF0D223_ODILC|nr:MAG: cobalamin-dependent protein [Candidatus Odinarchaeum yellowstonii]
MHKKILLINPPSPEFNMGLFPPLNLATIATYIPAEYEVEIIDCNLQNIHCNTDIACITANTYSIRRANTLCKKFRRLGIPVLFGGSHPSILPEESIKYADSIVIGDGEPVMPELLKDFEEGKLKKFYQP